jgi:hypothetical protein
MSSVVLWDARPGGILVDQGYIKIRPLSEDRWRVTRRKVLRFSDRTPYDNATPGWLDVGQTLNYLSPAALCLWMESETYSLKSCACGGAGEPAARAPSTAEA